MHSKITLLFIFSFLGSFTLYAQSKYEIGVEGGLTNIKYKIADEGNNLRNEKSISALPGINFRMNVKNGFFYEAGITLMNYVTGLKLKQEPGWSTGYSDQILMIPLRSGYNIKLNDRLSIVPVIGISTGIKTISADGDSLSWGWAPDPYYPSYTYTRRDVNKNVFLLLQSGISLDHMVARKFKISLGYNYYHGISDQAIFDIQYKLSNNDPTHFATMYGKGTFSNWQLGIKYLFGKKI